GGDVLSPAAPVQALAFPEMIVRACTRLCCRWSWSITTDADLTLFVVKTPPASHGSDEWMTQRSSLCPLGMAKAPAVKALIPHAAVPARKPRAKVRATGRDPRALSSG